MIRKPSLERRNDKVLIVAYGESMNETPWEDKSFDLYTLNAAHRLLNSAHASLWFQMHRPGSGDGHIDDKDHREWLWKWEGCPVLMLEKYDWVPQAVKYPFDEVVANCGPGRPFFGTSIDYMVAYAIYQQYKEIHLYGVDMLGHGLYQDAKHSLGWYLGVASGRGIALSIPKSSSVLKHRYIYGYEEEPGENRRLIAEIEKFKFECERDKQKALDEGQLAYGKAREQEGMRKAYANIQEILRLRDNGSQV